MSDENRKGPRGLAAWFTGRDRTGRRGPAALAMEMLSHAGDSYGLWVGPEVPEHLCDLHDPERRRMGDEIGRLRAQTRMPGAPGTPKAGLAGSGAVTGTGTVTGTVTGTATGTGTGSLSGTGSATAAGTAGAAGLSRTGPQVAPGTTGSSKGRN